MKKALKIMIIAWLTAVFILSGCQATPESDIVVQKDMEQMIEQAQSTPEASEGTLAQRLGAPEMYTASFSSDDGKLIINTDAVVSVPDAGTIPIYRVYSAGFAEEFADSVYQLLCGDTAMYAASESFTKDAIMEEILEQQQKIASGELDDEARAGTEAYIAQLEADYQSAPDTMGSPIASVMFQTKQEYGTNYTVFEVRENEAGESGKYFAVRNDTQFETEELQTMYGETVAPRSNAHLRYSDADIRPAEMMYELREVMGEEQADGMETAPIEAQAMAEELLGKIGADDMEVYSICLVADAPESSGTAMRYGYKVKLRRTVDGVCVNSPDYSTYVDDPTYGFEWHYETLSIGISDDGVYYLDWEAPLEVSEVVVADTTLKPFGDIMDVVQSMMCIVNEPEAHTAEKYRSIEFDITRITLSLQRISQQNSVTSGLLVPVWNFYGDKIFTYQDGTSYTLSERARDEMPDDMIEQIYYPFLSVNAVDGSIIDASKGY